MRLGRAKFVILLVCFSLACTVSQVLAGKKDKDEDQQASSPNDTAQRRALHALNRLTFGPRPGDVQQVMAMGVDQWIDLQLHPKKIDDSALDARLEPLRTLRMSAKEIAEDFPDGQAINQVRNGKRSMPSDPARRAVYQVQLARQEEKKEKKKEEAGKSVTAATAPEKISSAPAEKSEMAANAASDGAGSADGSAASGAMNSASMSGAANGAAATTDSMTSSTANDATMAPSPKPAKLTREEKQQARLHEQALYADLELQQLPSLSPDERFKKILGMPIEAQVAVADSLRGGKAPELLEGLNPKQKETLLAMNNPAGVVTGELAQAKLLRAIYSQRQFEEVMTDFWFNHFNVFVDKGLDRLMLTSYERDVIRAHALGKFEDLLVATAKSPAMLYYLDNWLSVGPFSAKALGIPEHPSPYVRYQIVKPKAGKSTPGLNENYGRELLELHTLSVNGGYSQRDVTEVAKVFSGWTIDDPAHGGSFKFDLRMHEPGPKYVLGHKIKPKGEDEGLEVLHRLATSPLTAHFISLKLAERFVSDDPPPALVDRMAKTFLKKKGDIREVLDTLFHSPEFWDDATYRAKVKTPLEFVASAVRATGAEIDDAVPLTRQLNNMGMPLYGAQPPTGYSMKADTWVSTSALLNRMNFALALTSGKIKGVKTDAAQLTGSSADPPDANLTLATLETSLIAGGVSQQTHNSITVQIEAAKIEAAKNAAAKKNNGQPKQDNKSKPGDSQRSPDANTMSGLLLGSPEFQRR
jgi:uncharacterized protein (DUF1800 family)